MLSNRISFLDCESFNPEQMDAAPPRKKCRTPPGESMSNGLEEQDHLDPVIKTEVLESPSITSAFPVAEAIAEDVVMNSSVQPVIETKDHVDSMINEEVVPPPPFTSSLPVALVVDAAITHLQPSETKEVPVTSSIPIKVRLSRIYFRSNINLTHLKERPANAFSGFKPTPIGLPTTAIPAVSISLINSYTRSFTESPFLKGKTLFCVSSILGIAISLRSCTKRDLRPLVVPTSFSVVCAISTIQ